MISHRDFFLRVFIDVHEKDGKLFGRLEILLFEKKVDRKVLEFFLDLCENFYKDCYVHKIMKNLFIETGDVKSTKSIFPKISKKPLTHNRDGLISMKLKEDGSVSTKFVITLQPLKILDPNHIVIGRVIEGSNILTDLVAHGTKFGIPKKLFFITVSSVKTF